MMDRLTSGGGPELRTDRISAHLAPNRGSNGGSSLIVGGVTQSHVNPDDPLDLQLEYVRLAAAIIDGVFEAGRPIAALHLGGGALSLPRYLSATRPGSRQHVVELYQELYEFVVEHLPLADDTITAEFVDAREAVERSDGGFDLVMVDVFSGDVAPRHISTAEFFTDAARLLTPDGVVVVNTLATHGLDFTREAAATLRAVFPAVAAIGAPAVLAGQRVGNVELVAGTAPLPLEDMRATLARIPGSFELVTGDALDAIVAGAAVRRD